MIQITVNWLATGLLYSLLAVGLTLIFSVMGVINFAHAQMYMLGAFALYYMYQEWHIEYTVAVVLASVIVACLGLVVERGVVRPVRDDPLRAMVTTLGLLVALEGAALLVFGPQERHLTPPLGGTVTVAGTTIAVEKIVAILASAVLLGGLFAYLKWTRGGMAMRAVAQDRDAAFLQGVRAERVNGLGFAIGSGLAAAAGALLLPVIATVDTGTGNLLLPKMFTIVVIGGLGSVSGATAGAFLLALIETIGYTYLGDYAILSAYLLVMAVLLMRPEGIMMWRRSVG